MTADIIVNSVSIGRNPQILRFRAAGANGDYIKFPYVAKTDKVTVLIEDYYDGRVFNQCGVTRQGVCDRYGFTLSKMASAPGTSPYWNNSDDPVEITVIAEEGFITEPSNTQFCLFDIF